MPHREVEPPVSVVIATPQRLPRPIALVMDDDLNTLKILSHSVAKVGMRALTAVNGVKGLEIMRDRAVDLLIIDEHMPWMDGYAVCKTVRQTSALPIIFMTCDVDPAAVARARQAGADAVVVKPLIHAELHAHIRRLLSGTPAL